ncbi:MAG TPA: hypothetical protein VFC46_08250 [Humisphaera sp.]|nr:hypothetical protein [Humisphaera sp.]
MDESVETTAKRSLKALSKLRKKIGNDPAKARAFLIRAGIAEKDPSGRNKIRLVKQLRSN